MPRRRPASKGPATGSSGADASPRDSQSDVADRGQAERPSVSHGLKVLTVTVLLAAYPLYYCSHNGLLSYSARLSAVVAVWVYTAYVVSRSGPVAQDEAYHLFADARCLACVPNFNDVASNLPFLAVGGAGVLALSGVAAAVSGGVVPDVPHGAIGSDEERAAWRAFFVGVALTCFGSAYYHWRPTSRTLVWDRLPMTIAFMAIFAVLLHEHAGIRASLTLTPLLAVGALSVALWAWTGDLRLYILVQYVPLLSIVLLFAMFAPRYDSAWYWLVALAFYAAAKFTEAKDKQIFAASRGVVSGHTLKHLLAAGTPAVALAMLLARRPL